MNCEEIEELAGAYALGALTDEESSAVATHLATCDRHPEMPELQATAASLALAVEEVEPPPALKSRLMAAIEAETPASARTAAIAAESRKGLGDTIRRWFASPRLGYGLSAALALAVVGLLAWNISLQGGSSGQVVVNISGSATGQVTYLKDQHLAVVDVHGLAQLPAGKVYEAWSLTGGAAKALGILQVETSGDVLASMPLGDAAIDQIAVTVEQAPGVDQPTTTPIFSAAFS